MQHLSYAFGQNHFLLDADLQAILPYCWPAYPDHQGELQSFGAWCGREIYQAAYHIDQESPPVLIHHDLDGQRIDRVRLSPVEAGILPKLASILLPPYQGGSWQHHFALGYLLADPGLYCILTITGQTAYALHKYAPQLASIKEKLLSGQYWGATWMTENQGGNDLGANRTRAVVDSRGNWRLHDGDKYFASGAGLTDWALTTARPEGAPPGAKGLALFLLPRLTADGSLNFHVRRLKNKSATRAVPSGEVELVNAEALLIGDPKEGIYYTMEVLTVSRIANAIASMGIAAKSLLESQFRVRRRSAFGQTIMGHPLVRRDLAEMRVRQAGGLALAFMAVSQFDQVWQSKPPYPLPYHQARLWSHLAKNRTAEHASRITALAMELFGGLGFLEEFAVARWHREALITPIWEGTSNIQALELLEVIRKKKAHEPFLEWLGTALDEAHTPEARLAWAQVRKTVEGMGTETEAALQWSAKNRLRILADAASVALLYGLGVQDARFSKLASLYTHHLIAGEELPSWACTDPEIWDFPEFG